MRLGLELPKADVALNENCKSTGNAPLLIDGRVLPRQKLRHKGDQEGESLCNARYASIDQLENRVTAWEEEGRAGDQENF